MKNKLYKQRRVKPYQASGKTTFNLRGKPGVYLIYSGERVVYVGYSGTNLYKTMYRHFQKWNDRTQQKRVVYRDLKGITVRVVYTNNAGTASKLEKALIVKHKPRDNDQLLDFDKDTVKSTLKVYSELTAKPIITSNEALPF
jgi:excinuclease UvrABC nuclease subunit